MSQVIGTNGASAPSSPAVTVDPLEAEKFLSWLGNQSGSLYTLDPNDLRPPFCTHQITKQSLPAFLARNAGQNVYFSINKVTQSTKKTTKEDISEAWFLHVDVDPVAGQDADEILDLFDCKRPSDIPEPSALIFSGRGYQALFRLASPLGRDQFEAVESANKWLSQRLGGDPCQNIDRVFRLPGAINCGAASKPKGLRQVRAFAVWVNDNTYTLDNFGVGAATPVKSKSGAPAVAYTVTASAEKVENLGLLRGKVSDHLKYLISYGPPGDMSPDNAAEYVRQGLDKFDVGKKDHSRSGYVFSVCCGLVAGGVPDSQILGILTDSAWGISRSVLEKANVERETERLVRRAHELVGPVAPEAKSINLKEDSDWLIGAPKKVKKAVLFWIKNDDLEEEQAVIDWMVQSLGREVATKLVEENFGEKYKKCLPKDTTDFLPGQDLPALTETALKKLPVTWSHDEELYVFERNKYRLASTAQYHTMIARALSGFTVVSGKNDEKVGLYKSHYSEITNNIVREKDAEPSTDEVVLFRNGYLKDGVFHTPTPNLRITGGPDCNYDPHAKCEEWMQFLNAQWSDEQESIDLLQELMGLFLVDDVSHHVATVFSGPTRSGKGVIVRTIRKLIGEEFFAAFSVNGIAGQFGLQPMLGKTVAAASDIRGPFDQKVKSVAREVILGIAGADVMEVNRKGKSIIPAQLRTRMIMVFNEIEDARTLLMDGKGATAKRLRALKTTKSFAGEEDRELEDRLALELPGIALWALKGLQRLRKQGFTLNHATKVLRTSTTNTQITDFLDEAEPAIVWPYSTTALYGKYKEWAIKSDLRLLSPKWFSINMLDAVPNLLKTDNARKLIDGSRHRFFYLKGQEDKIKDQPEPEAF